MALVLEELSRNTAKTRLELGHLSSHPESETPKGTLVRATQGDNGYIGVSFLCSQL